METIEQVICRNVYEFIKDKIDEIESHFDFRLKYITKRECWQNLGYEGPNHFLARVQNNINDAVYALQYVMRDYMDKDYFEDYIICNNNKILKMFDGNNKERYFYFKFCSAKPIEIEKPILEK